MLENLEYRFLKRFFPERPGRGPYSGTSKLRALLGEHFPSQIVGKTVIDFGCGEGNEAVEMARAGAERVIAVDIRPEMLASGRKKAEAAGVSGNCEFTLAPRDPADLILSIDGFEHFADPAKVLEVMAGLLRPGGIVILCFGPTWCHPRGGHLFSPFPWAHLLLDEKALIRWRADFRSDGAARFSDVSGGLNQMTIRRFEQLIEASPLLLESVETIPIRALRPVHNRLTREFTTSGIRARMTRRSNC